MFDRRELRWIKELVEDEIARRKANKEWGIWGYDEEIFESILQKIEKES